MTDLINFIQKYEIHWIVAIVVCCIEFTPIKINPLSWLYKTFKNKITEDIQKDNVEIHNELKAVKKDADNVYHIKSKHWEDICKWQNNTDKMVEELKNTNTQLISLIDSLSDKLDEMAESQDEDKISKKRWDILSFSDSLKSGNRHSKDSFHHIFETSDKYHELIDKRGFKNGLIDVEMEYITKVYKRCLEEDDFS